MESIVGELHMSTSFSYQHLLKNLSQFLIISCFTFNAHRCANELVFVQFMQFRIATRRCLFHCSSASCLFQASHHPSSYAYYPNQTIASICTCLCGVASTDTSNPKRPQTSMHGPLLYCVYVCVCRRPCVCPRCTTCSSADRGNISSSGWTLMSPASPSPCSACTSSPPPPSPSLLSLSPPFPSLSHRKQAPYWANFEGPRPPGRIVKDPDDLVRSRFYALFIFSILGEGLRLRTPLPSQAHFILDAF